MTKDILKNVIRMTISAIDFHCMDKNTEERKSFRFGTRECRNDDRIVFGWTILL